MKTVLTGLLLALTTPQAVRAAVDLSDMVSFKDRAEATEWVRDYVKVAKLPNPVVDSSDSRFDAMDEVIRDVWPVAMDLYPDFAGLPAPQVIGVVSPGATFQTISHPVTHKIPLLILSTTAGLDRMADLRFNSATVFAHEFAHLLMLHSRQGVKEKVRKFYRVTTGREVMGFLQADDPQARADALAWTALMKRAGPYFEKELGEVPYSSTYQPLFEYLLDKKAGNGSPSCEEARKARTEWLNYLSTAYSYMDFTLSRLIPLDQVRIATRSETIRSRTIDCFKDRVSDLASLTAEMNGVSVEEARKVVNVNDAALFDTVAANTSNLAEGLFALTRALRAEMKMVYVEKDIAHLRQYWTEEQADDVAFRIMTEVVRRMPEKGYILDGSLWGFETYMTYTEREFCKERVARGRVPPFGNFQGNAAAFCYRHFHWKMLAEQGFPGPF